MSRFFLIFIFLLSACSHAPTKKTVELTQTYDPPQLHHADCYINNTRYSESNLLLLSSSPTTYTVKASDGKNLGLPVNQCILSKVETESSFDEHEPKQRWMMCKLGVLKLVTDSLIMISDDKGFLNVKRKDGQVWKLPREHCSSYPFYPLQNN